MNILLALLIFTIIVVAHEFGHFLLAKKNGIDVIEFSVGMGPRLITVVKTETGFQVKFLCSEKTFENKEDWKGITKYSWKLFPIGGSCAMLGEDMDDSSEGSFNSKGVWARFSVIFAGPFFNFLLAFVFSIIILGNAGIDIPQVVSVYAGQPAETAGIQNGDMIKRVNGHKITIGRDIDTYLQLHPLTGEKVTVEVERNGKEKTFTYSPNYKTSLFGFYYTGTDKASAKVDSVSEKGAFDKAGIKAGDIITQVGDTKISNGKQLTDVMEKARVAGKKIEIKVTRKNKNYKFTVSPEPYEGKTLGFLATKSVKKGPLGIIKYSFYEVKYWIVSTIGSLGQLIGGKLSMNDVSGPVGIVSTVGGAIKESADYGIKYMLLNILYFSVLLSANLGVMNLLPIPALDGGRLVFILIEAFRGKPIDREKEGFVHLIGFVLLMAFMVFVMYHDIIKIIK